MSVQNRNKRIDILKGIAIVLVVMGHSGISCARFIYLFHMALFFIVSGQLYKFSHEEGITGIKDFVVRKIKRLWVPYFIFTVIFTLLNNTFLRLGIYNENGMSIAGGFYGCVPYMTFRDMAVNIIKAVFFSGRTRFGNTFWFLKTLFILNVLFIIVDYILGSLKIYLDKKGHSDSGLIVELIHLIFALLLLIIGSVCSEYGVTLFGLAVVFSCYILFFLGHIFNKYAFLDKINDFLLVCIGLVGLCIAYYFSKKLWLDIELSDNSYSDMVHLLFSSLMGYFFVYGISGVIIKSKAGYLVRLFEYLGKNTMCIVLNHLWCFKAVHLIQIIIYGYPFNYLAAFPSLDTNEFWWIAYVIVGVGLPILLSKCVHRCLTFFVSSP